MTDSWSVQLLSDAIMQDTRKNSNLYTTSVQPRKGEKNGRGSKETDRGALQEFKQGTEENCSDMAGSRIEEGGTSSHHRVAGKEDEQCWASKSQHEPGRLGLRLEQGHSSTGKSSRSGLVGTRGPDKSQYGIPNLSSCSPVHPI